MGNSRAIGTGDLEIYGEFELVFLNSCKSLLHSHVRMLLLSLHEKKKFCL